MTRVRRLASLVLVAVGLGGLWLSGELGFRIGFAPLVEVPALVAGPGGGLATATAMVLGSPRVVLRAGVEAPGLLMLGLALGVVAGAGLAGARPLPRGAGPPTRLTAVLSGTGAVAAALAAAAVLWWTVCPARTARIREIPFDARDGAAWLTDLQAAAGLDVVAVTAAAVWAVLVMRLGIPSWMRALAAPANFLALAVAAAAASASNAAVAEFRAPRSLVLPAEGPLDPRLLVGYTPSQVACLRLEGRAAIVELQDPGAPLTVIGRQSIASMLVERGRE